MGQTMTTRIILPSPNSANAAEQALWTGQAFVVGTATERILSYPVRDSGWNDGIARFHRQEAASDHFIDIASRAHTMKEVKRSIVQTPSVILEIGCAAGHFLRELLQQLHEHVIIGSDYTLDTLQVVGLPSVPLLRFDLSQCPLPDNFADVAVLLNVLEHIEDDESAVAHLFRILRPGGVAIIEVPAKAALFDIYDRVLMHFRRYDMHRLTRLLRKAGVAAIVVLGGDGTHRAVVSQCATIPIAGISTGTNNAFPEYREPTVTGLATGLAVMGRVPRMSCESVE